jgi:hypothetical protein
MVRSTIARSVAWVAIAAGLWLANTPGAFAQTSLFDEVRFGAFVHSVEPGNPEDGADLNLELLFRRPTVAYDNPFLDWALRPRPHIGASLNLVGDTSQLYAGFTWDVKLAPALTLEVSLGGALHDGGEDLYGCSVNFRESLSLGYALDARWTVYGTVSHMSNAGLCDNNTGLTSVGLRLGYKLK